MRAYAGRQFVPFLWCTGSGTRRAKVNVLCEHFNRYYYTSPEIWLCRSNTLYWHVIPRDKTKNIAYGRALSTHVHEAFHETCNYRNSVGWLCLTSHRQRGHLETAPPFTVPCEGRGLSTHVHEVFHETCNYRNSVGWLCLTSHRQRGHLETTPPFTVPCEGREAR